MNLRIEIEQETDGRWIAEVRDLPGVMAYGASRDAATASVKVLAQRVLADRLEQGSTQGGRLGPVRDSSSASGLARNDRVGDDSG